MSDDEDSMLNGKYWLIPGGRVVDVTASEHAIFARKFMLRLPDADLSITIKNMLSPLTPRQISCHRRRGISEDILNFLSADRSSNDPRVFAINTWFWIRARFVRRTAGLWLRRFDDEALQTIRDAADFWKAQTRISEFDMIDVTELASDACYEVTVSRLRDYSSNATQILTNASRKLAWTDAR